MHSERHNVEAEGWLTGPELVFSVMKTAIMFIRSELGDAPRLVLCLESNSTQTNITIPASGEVYMATQCGIIFLIEFYFPRPRLTPSPASPLSI